MESAVFVNLPSSASALTVHARRSGVEAKRQGRSGIRGLCLLTSLAFMGCSGGNTSNEAALGGSASGVGGQGAGTIESASGGSSGESKTTKNSSSAGGKGAASAASTTRVGNGGGASSVAASVGGSATGGSGTGRSGTGGNSLEPNTTGGRSSVQTSPEAGGGTAAGGSSGSASGTGVGVVTLTKSTFKFQHFPIEVNSDGVWNGPSSPGTQATSTTYDTLILENDYLRVTVLPDYGGRVLSLLHKPTNRELLYQNPIGTPYLMGEDIFYYNYLVIMGGIFPSFPEPEHGKYWNQPYALTVVSESDDAVTIRMSREDDRDRVTGVPSRYDVGRTDMLVELDVTLRAGSTSLELSTKLTNTRNTAVSNFEYWTVTTLAPGSTPGKTAIPLNTRILAAMSKVRLLEDSWSWFGNAETRVSEDVFEWNNLSYFKNWVDQGTAFANPDYRANWSGLMNPDNDTAILHVSDNDNAKTPGLKLWTFGKGSLEIDINDSSEWLRPTIEMWHGVTPEFWKRGSMAANEVRQWTDYYLPTFGLKEITAASEYGALQLSSSKSGADTLLNAAASLTLPNQTVKAVLRLGDKVVAEQDVTVSATQSTTLSATVPTSDAPAGAVFEAEFLQGEKSLLAGQKALQ